MFSALIFLRPRPPLFGGGPSSPASPPLFLIGSAPMLLANPESRFAEATDPWRVWLLEDVGVAGVTASDVF